MVERFNISLNTPAGQFTTPVDVPTGFVPVTAIVPLLRSLGEQAEALEERRAIEAGDRISCRQGCAACCRMLVPISAPEAFALREMIQTLPQARQETLRHRIAEAQATLEQAHVFSKLTALAESDRPFSDEELDPLNRDYYALRMACPYLENEACSIYHHRPAACRELLVTSPATLCDDMANNPVRSIPVSVRISTALGLLWAELTGSAARLIPLPIALDWAERHLEENERTWKGSDLLDKALDKVWRFLSQEFQKRQGARG
ncbi:MAG: YkgJ family cysteine cluster protein [Nitrospiraceae bacterium]